METKHPDNGREIQATRPSLSGFSDSVRISKGKSSENPLPATELVEKSLDIYKPRALCSDPNQTSFDLKLEEGYGNGKEITSESGEEIGESDLTDSVLLNWLQTLATIASDIARRETIRRKE